MLRFAPKRKNQIPSVIVVCILAILSVRLSKYYSKTQMVNSTNSFAATTNKERIEFLIGRGIKTDTEPLYVGNVVVPSSFDARHMGLATMQNVQGHSLSEYEGEELEHFSYNVQNSEEKTSAEILVSDGEIVFCVLCRMTNNIRIFEIIG